MATNAIRVVRSIHEGLVREVEAQVVDPGKRIVPWLGDPQRADEAPKYVTNRVGMKLAAMIFDRDEDEGALACLLRSALQVLVQPFSHRRVQGEPSALVELRVADDEPDLGHVFEPQVERF